MTDKVRFAAESAAEVAYHQAYDCGATMEDCINAAQEAYEHVAGEKMEGILDFFGIDEEEYELYKDD